jgi:hypothetical protein
VSPIGPGPLGWASLPGRCSALVPSPLPRWRRLAELLAEEKNGGLHHGKIAVYGGLMHLNMKTMGDLGDLTWEKKKTSDFAMKKVVVDHEKLGFHHEKAGFDHEKCWF